MALILLGPGVVCGVRGAPKKLPLSYGISCKQGTACAWLNRKQQQQQQTK